jgi:hypothetical protein
MIAHNRNAYDRYIRIVEWAKQRYTINGSLVLYVGDAPSPFTIIERLAWGRYIVPAVNARCSHERHS